MTSLYRLPADCYAVEVDGRACVYQADRQAVVILNETATRVWQLATTSGPSRIVSRLSAEYTAPDSTIADDVRTALDVLLSAGLLEEKSG